MEILQSNTRKAFFNDGIVYIILKSSLLFKIYIAFAFFLNSVILLATGKGINLVILGDLLPNESYFFSSIKYL